MSADKYAQFIAEQQRKLSVSGVNAVDLQEKKELSDKQKKIAAQAGDPEKIEGEDFAKLRAQKEEVEQVEEGVGVSNRVRKGIIAGAKTKGSEEEHKAIAKIAGKLFGGPEVEKTYGTARKMFKKEETEQVDEVRAIQGVHASKTRKAPSITPSKVKYKGKGTKPKVQSDLNIMASYEIDATEMEQIDEAVKSGRTKELMDFYTKGMAIHKDKMDHHTNMAKMCADCGDDDGWHYHMGRVTDHRFEHEANKGRADRVAGLAAKVKEVADRAEINDKLDKLNRKA
jgi:hypothetical protein